MQVDFKQINEVRRDITVRIEAETISKEWDRYLKKSAKQMNVPGFRPGKAPLSMIKRLYGESLQDKFEEEMVAKYFDEAMETHNIQYLLFPQINEVKWQENEDMLIEVEIEHEPEIHFAQLENLRVPHTPIVLEEEVQEYILRLMQEQGRMVDKEIAAQEDSVDVEVRFDYEGEEKVYQGRLVAGEGDTGDYRPELIGKKTGDELEIELKGNMITVFSQGLLHQHDQEAMYPVKMMVNSITRTVYPEIDDDFARDLEFEDLEQMKAKITEEMRLKNEHKNMEAQNYAIIAKLFLDNKFALPQRTIEYLAKQETERTLGKDHGTYYQYFFQEYLMQISQDMVQHFILKSLEEQMNIAVTDEMKTEYNRHYAILQDMSLEAYEEKNKEEIGTEDYLNNVKSHFNLRKVAETAEFHLPEPKDEAAELIEEAQVLEAEIEPEAEVLDTKAGGAETKPEDKEL